ncbi:MAG TPA: hydroxymethylbilane synthase, partial [Armatimonadota bacterium]|nr:hydroxymethylbilane synthase [Armatimonadota bacterium]
MNFPLRIGTRGSKLALCQAQMAARVLHQCGIETIVCVIETKGDRQQDRIFSPQDGQGVFTAEIEKALLEHRIDLAVHSLKDLPPERSDELIIAAIMAREDSRDAFVGRTASTLASLPPGAIVGTSSVRRKMQLLALRPDIRIVDMRGNIDTRLRKLDDGQYDAICLAAAGLRRLGLASRISEYFPLNCVTPAAGQGALAVQIRRDNMGLAAKLATLEHDVTRRAVCAERTVLAELGGGCTVPLGVHA